MPAQVLKAAGHRGSDAACSPAAGGMKGAAAGTQTTDAPAARTPSPTATGEPAGPPTSGSAPPQPTARTCSANGGRASSASSDDVAMPVEGEAEPLRVCVDSRERLRWSPALHQCFVDAVNALGGSAFAKPKDIVAKMSVPGLTLAHVKSHLQKYRAAEGVTFVPHSMRGSAGAVRRLQQHLAKQQRQQQPSDGSSEAEGMELPPAKRACILPSAFNAPPAQALPSSSWATVPAPAAAADTLQSYLSALSTALPPPPLPELQAAVQLPLPLPQAAVQLPLPLPQAAAAGPSPPSASEQEEAASALLVLAELASSQHEELQTTQAAAEAQAASLASLPPQLAAAVEAAPAAAEQPGLRAQLAALRAQQSALKARLEEHLQQAAALSEEVGAVWRRASELLASPQLGAKAVTPAQLRVRQQLQQAVAATAMQQRQQPSLTSLVSLISSLAASQQGPSPPAPTLAGGLAPSLLQLLQLHSAQQAQQQ